MATTYNIEIREFNGIDYDILYPRTIMGNVLGLQDTIDTINTNIGTINTNIGTINTKIATNTTNISNLSGDITDINGDISDINDTIDSINTNISSLQGDISTIDTNKPDTEDLGTLAFKDVVALGTDGDVTGILPVANGGTGADSPSMALLNLGITISNTEIEEGDELASGLIYIYYE